MMMYSRFRGGYVYVDKNCRLYFNDLFLDLSGGVNRTITLNQYDYKSYSNIQLKINTTGYIELYEDLFFTGDIFYRNYKLISNSYLTLYISVIDEN